MRQHILTAAQEVLVSAGFVEPWGPYDSLSHLVERVWGPDATRNVVYSTKGEFGKANITIDAVLSGELGTINLNNITNRASFKQFLDDYAERSPSDALRLHGVQFQGDDAEQFWELADPSALNAEEYRKLVLTLEESAKRNGLELNALKTLCRMWFSEYLKVSWLGGRNVPLAHIEMLTSERPSGNEWPVDVIRNQISKMQEVVFRGGDSHMWSVFMMCQYALRGSLRSGTGKSSRLVYMPVTGLMCPSGMGGVGMIPWLPVCAAKDFVIAYTLMNLPKTRALVERASYVLQIDPSREARKLADAFIEGRTEPSNLFKAGLDYIDEHVLLPERRKAAVEANRRLKSNGAPSLGSLYYIDLPVTMVRDAVEQNTNISQYDAASRIQQGARLVRRIKEEGSRSILDEYPWIGTTPLIMNGEITPQSWDVDPFPCMSDAHHLVARTLGLRVTGGTRKRFGANIAERLRRLDPDFPRVYQPEQVMGFLLHPAIAENPNRIKDALVAMGASEHAATILIPELTQFITNTVSAANLRGLSINDSVLPDMDWSDANIRRIVSDPGYPNPQVNRFLSQLGVIVSLSESLRSGATAMRRCQFALSRESVYDIEKLLGSALSFSTALAATGTFIPRGDLKYHTSNL
jgi:hypothetical protein